MNLLSMNNLFSFYDYCDYAGSLIYEVVLDELFFDDNFIEETKFGIKMQDTREFECFLDLFGCIDNPL